MLYAIKGKRIDKSNNHKAYTINSSNKIKKAQHDERETGCNKHEFLKCNYTQRNTTKV